MSRNVMSPSRRKPRWTLLEPVLVTIALLVFVVVIAVIRLRDPDDTASRAGHTGEDFHSLVADPATADRLYVGGHVATSASNDGGRTWAEIDSLVQADTMGWAFGDEALWTSGHPGISVSTDGGNAFVRRNDGLPDTDIHALGGDHHVLFAAGPRVGLLSSSDGGTTWSQVSESTGASFVGRIALSAEDPDHLVAADATTGPVISEDGGGSWRPLTEFPTAWISADPSLTTIVASGSEGAIISYDGGASWDQLELPTGATLVELDRDDDGGRLYAGLHDGEHVTVQISDDGGTTWRDP